MAKIGTIYCGDGIKLGDGLQVDLAGNFMEALVLGTGDARIPVQFSVECQLYNKSGAARPEINLTELFLGGTISVDNTRDLIRNATMQWRYHPDINYFSDQFDVFFVYTLGDATDGDTLTDVELVTANFGRSGVNIPGDLNADGTVDIFDFSLAAAEPDDGTSGAATLRVPLGRFYWTLPQETISLNDTILDLEAFDATILLQQTHFSLTKLLPTGTNVFQVLTSLIAIPELGAPAIPITGINAPVIPRSSTPSAYFLGQKPLDLVGPFKIADRPTPTADGEFDAVIRLGSLPSARSVKYLRVGLQSGAGFGATWSNYPTAGGDYPNEYQAALVYVDDYTCDLYFSPLSYTYADTLNRGVYHLRLELTDGTFLYLTDNTITGWTQINGAPIYAIITALPYERTWEPNKSVLDCMNDCLTSAGFSKVYFDRYGYLSCRPQTTNPFGLLPPVRYATDEYSILLDPVVRKYDLSNMANKVTVYSENPDGDPVVSDPQTNASPSSPISTINLGRVQSRTIKVDNLISKEAANVIAISELIKASSIIEQVTISTVPDPRRDPFESYELEVVQDDGTETGSTVINNRYDVDSWSLPLRLEAMTHQLRKLTPLV